MKPTPPELPEHLADYARELREMLRQTTPTYRPLAEERVREFEDNIARLQADIDAHKAAIVLLKAKQEQMEESVRAGRSLLTPIRRMPQELLRRIFSVCCEDGTRFSIGRTGFDRIPQPVLLSMVCALWRDIAISSSTLWSNMRYSFVQDPGLEDGEICLRITQMFLQRAGSAPLTLSFDSDNVIITPPIDLSLDALCRRANQWDSVSFNVPCSVTQRPSFQIAKGNLLHLRTIKIFERIEEADTPSFDFLVPCPTLRQAKLNICLHGSHGLFPSMPWQQLSRLSLDIRAFDALTASQILPLCTNLTDLQFSIIPLSGAEVGQNTQRIIVPTLRSLTVRRIREGCPAFPHFFQRFTFPRLTALHIEDHNPGKAALLDEEDIACLVEFLKHSSSSLSILSLGSSTHLSVERAFRLLQHTSRLTSLHLNEKRFFSQPHDGLCTPLLLKHLTRTPSLPPLLPRLSHLRITIFSEKFGDEEYQQLVEAVRSRVIPTSRSDAELGIDCLQSVKVEFLDHWATFPECLGPLEELRGEGLRVILPERKEIKSFEDHGMLALKRLGRSLAPNSEVPEHA